MNHPRMRGSKTVMVSNRPVGMMVLVLAVLLQGVTPAQENEASKPRGTSLQTTSGGRVTIDAKSVLYDFTERLAVFENEVHVTDSEIALTADRMSVYLDKENSVRRIESVGNVVIRELGTAKRATAGKAVYDVAEDTVVLTEQPQLEERDQGFITRDAERIIYYRGKQQFKAEGENMRIEFGIPEPKGTRAGDLFRSLGGGAEEKKE